MKPIAAVAFSAAAILALGLAIRYGRVERIPATGEIPNPPDDPDSVVILPPVSSGWSNFNVQPAPASGPAPRTAAPAPAPAAPVIGRAETPPAPNPEALGARVKDIFARLSVETVGLDPEADRFWLAAVNDPNLAAEDRHALIQALHEAGFADPRRLTADDLPLIVSRIALVEQLAVQPLDPANAEAFQETYRQLLNMFSTLAGPDTPENASPFE